MAESYPGSSPCGESDDPDLIRFYNDAVIALNIIYTCAAKGSGAAREIFESEAERLVQAAGRFSQEPRREQV